MNQTQRTFPVLPDRPYVICNMISTADGKATMQGVAHTIGDKADHQNMMELRRSADAVLCGVGTLIKEDIIPFVDEDIQQARVAAGKPAFPRGMTITGRADLPWEKDFFKPEYRPTVFLTGADEGELVKHAEMVKIEAKTSLPDLVKHAKTELGVDLLLLEGGPTLNHGMLAAGLIDELFLTVAPRISGLSGISIVEGDALLDAGLELIETTQVNNELFLRYRIIHENLSSDLSGHGQN